MTMSDIMPAVHTSSTPRRFQSFKCLGCKSIIKAPIKSQKYKAKCPKCQTPFSLSTAGTVCFSSPGSSLALPASKPAKEMQKNKKEKAKSSQTFLSEETHESMLPQCSVPSAKTQVLKTARASGERARKPQNTISTSSGKSGKSSAQMKTTSAKKSSTQMKTTSAKKSSTQMKTTSAKKSSVQMKTTSAKKSSGITKPSARSSTVKSLREKAAKNTARGKEKKSSQSISKMPANAILSEKAGTGSSLWVGIGKNMVKEICMSERLLAKTSQRIETIEKNVVKNFEEFEQVKESRKTKVGMMIALMILPLLVVAFFLMSAVPDQGFTTKGQMKELLTQKGDTLRNIFGGSK